MRRYGVINEAHFLETREEVELQRAKFARYRDAGALGPDLIFGHFIQTTPEIIAEPPRRRAHVVAARSNGRLASGTADISAIRAPGMPIGIGLDDQACTDVSDPWQNMRMGIYVRARRDRRPRSVLAADVLGCNARLGGGARRRRQGRQPRGRQIRRLPRRRPAGPTSGPLWEPMCELRARLRPAQPEAGLCRGSTALGERRRDRPPRRRGEQSDPPHPSRDHHGRAPGRSSTRRSPRP